jgi:hypothetical protein
LQEALVEEMDMIIHGKELVVVEVLADLEQVLAHLQAEVQDLKGKYRSLLVQTIR